MKSSVLTWLFQQEAKLFWHFEILYQTQILFCHHYINLKPALPFWWWTVCTEEHNRSWSTGRREFHAILSCNALSNSSTQIWNAKSASTSHPIHKLVVFYSVLTSSWQADQTISNLLKAPKGVPDCNNIAIGTCLALLFNYLWPRDCWITDPTKISAILLRWPQIQQGLSFQKSTFVLKICPFWHFWIPKLQ